jgi:nucleoside-diphosphate kinase
MGAIFDIIHSEGFYIRNMRMAQFTKASAKVFYCEHTDKDFYPKFADYIVSGPVIGMHLGRLDAVSHWRNVIGPRVPEEARIEAPESIRAKFAQSGRVNTVHGADCEKTKIREKELFFKEKTLIKRLPPVYPNTILMLTPKILQDGKLGKIVSQIVEAGCSINAMQMFTVDQLMDLQRKLGDEALKVIRKKVTSGHSLFLDVSHSKGYDILLEEMLRIENVYDTGFTHFDRGEEHLTESVFL